MQFHKLTNSTVTVTALGALGLLISMAPAVRAQVNLVTNGDFSAGNTLFSTDYSLATGSQTTTGQYAITTNPNASFPTEGYTSYGDHTTGTGNMLLIDGSGTTNQRAWYETLSLAANTNYNFSYWVASADSMSPAVLTFSAASTQIGSAFSVTSAPGVFEQVTGTFNSGAGGSVTVAIRDTNATTVGNDFTLDDIKVSATAPEPGALWFAVSGLFTAAGCNLLRRRRG